MAVIINASTSTGLVQSADTSGEINLQSNGTTVLGVTSTGTSVTGTQSVSGNLSFNSGYGSSAVAYGCRAWVNFNGSNGARRGSGNVSSVTRDSTGQYTINFTTAMPDLNYSVSLSGDITFSGGVFYGYGLNNYAAWTTSSCKVRFVNGSGTYYDADIGCISVFR